MANLLGGAPVGVLRLRDGTIHLPTADGQSKRSRRSMHASTQAPARGAMSSFGSFELRDETVRFALDSGAPSETADGSAFRSI